MGLTIQRVEARAGELMNAVTGLGVIENAGPNHLRGFLKQHLRSATGVDIAVAFVTRAGLAVLLPALKKASMNGPVHLLTGLYQSFTEPEALSTLLGQQIATNGRLSVSLSTNLHFHWKAYFLFNGSKVTAVIGSSNLTVEGLEESGELNVFLSMQRHSSGFRSMHRPFDEEWRAAVPLNRGQIERYGKARPKFVRRASPSMSLKQILGGPTTATKMVKKIEQQYWREWIEGIVSKKTEKAVYDATNWDDRGYDWYASGEPRHHRGDHIILFDTGNNSAKLVEVISKTEMKWGTPDGRYFTAYRAVRNSHRRKITKARLEQLRASSLIRRQSGIRSSRKLRSVTFDRFRECLEL